MMVELEKHQLLQHSKKLWKEIAFAEMGWMAVFIPRPEGYINEPIGPQTKLSEILKKFVKFIILEQLFMVFGKA